MSIRDSRDHSQSPEKTAYGQAAPTTKDPKRKSSPAILVCPECGIIQTKKRWFHDAEILESKKKEYLEKLCPGCEAVKNGWVEGEVVLKNRITFLVPQQIENMIKNQEKKALDDDCRNRVVKIQKFKNMWKVFTASVFLARMIGEHLEKQYQSKTSYKFGRGQKYVYVVWE
ncbi:hypothetical protein HYV44_00490 [Candidatus Microgenomates bacterium]|nr:hypothetical protein [Candidatus Microgenomates bacterium]